MKLQKVLPLLCDYGRGDETNHKNTTLAPQYPFLLEKKTIKKELNFYYIFTNYNQEEP